jgi:hypothetical protein
MQALQARAEIVGGLLFFFIMGYVLGSTARLLIDSTEQLWNSIVFSQQVSEWEEEGNNE